MAIWPDYVCRNPACPSFGKSHPNCKCGPPHMAKGGEVHFCSENRPHKPGCEYFKDGGVVSDVPRGTSPQSSVAASLFHSGASQLLTGNMHGVYGPSDNLDHYSRIVKKGSKAIDSHIESLFGGDKPDSQTQVDPDKLDEYVSKGKLQDQITEPVKMAKGGDVPRGTLNQGPMEQAMPEHNLLLQSAKSRINNYLQSQRPSELPPTLPFDTKHEDVNKKRSYQLALDLANHPHKILTKTRDGSLTPEHLKHFMGLYPDVHDHLAKKMTERIVKSQIDNVPRGTSPKYHTKQAMSMFLGAPMDSTFTPSSIQAAQASFIQQQPKPPAASKTKNLKDQAKQAQTPDQAAEARAQNSK
jgi:hypothetical protein